MRIKTTVKSSKKRSGSESWDGDHDFRIFAHDFGSLNSLFFRLMEERAVAAFGTTGIHFELPAKFIFLDFEITELRFYGAAGPLVDG